MAAWFRALLTLLLLPLALADSECGGFELISGSGLENLESLWVKVLDSPEVDLDEECWEKCCADPNCDLAMLRGPQSECHLISCAFNGLDMCDLKEMEGARAYKRGGLGPKPTQTDFCLPKPETGRCRAYFPRWFYDAETQTCQNFTYGGCPGNLNNHLEEQSCLSKCSGVSVVDPSNDVRPPSKRTAEALSLQLPVTEPDTTKPPNTLNYEESCAAPKYTGPCRAAFRRWYYDTETRSCATFTYGGCQGNKNNYLSESDCTRTCVDSMPEPGKVKAPKSAKFLEYCAVPKYTGPCRAAFQRWYYNTETESCSTFTYGGCQGNKNNYLSEDDCTQTCIGEATRPPPLLI
uniref:Uncharacterized protein n=1 Tax=Leptobrachium leishanense TaxID=445787 RepID=A0A8C5QVX3_9ANUR